MPGRGSKRALVFCVGLFLAAMCWAWTASAAASKLEFDPTLSLTGGCTESTLDPVPDPDCPSGPLPEESFSDPTSVATNSYGDVYVASFGLESNGSEGRIDIFDPSGHFLIELKDSDGPKSLAVDSVGNLYVVNGIDANSVGRRIVRYKPTLYEPAAGNIAYGGSPAVVSAERFSPLIGLAVDPSTDHLFAYVGTKIIEYGSAAEGNPQLDASIGEGVFESGSGSGMGLALDAARGRIYASSTIREEVVKNGKTELIITPVIRVLELAAPHNLLTSIDGSTTPGGKFTSNLLSLAVTEGNGHLFVFDELVNRLYELTESGGYVETLEHGFQLPYGGEIGADNGEQSPTGALNPRGRYVFVPSNPTGTGHSFAFGPPEQCQPKVTSLSFTDVGESEAELGATVDPCHLETSYVVEYTTEAKFEEEGGFGGAQVAGAGKLPAAAAPTKVSATAEGLSPGTHYRFRVVATNEEGSAEAEGSFSTYPPGPGPDPSCPNAGVRTGLSSLLPDCRGYELVTPPDTNARTPLGLGRLGTFFPTQEASPSGEKVSFRLEGGTIPSLGGTGSVNGDPYVATRGEGGWSSSYAGPPPSEAPVILTGSHSPDQGYSFWDNAGVGSTAVNGEFASYIRYPDGHSSLVGRGSIGTAPQAVGDLISENGDHIIFSTSGLPGAAGIRLEPNSPPEGTVAIYDRTPDEVTHVVSLLPNDVTPGEGEDASFQGASLDGRGIAFKVGSTLYLRYAEDTFEVGEGVTFAGVTDGGTRVFYLEGGNLFRFDAQTKAVKAFSVSGDVTPVNVSADGAAAYVVSPSVLTEVANSNGDKPMPGGENLYLSREGAISFVGTVTERDVVGDKIGNELTSGLGLWTSVVWAGGGTPGRLGADPSRVTPDGSVFLFQSRADLTGYDPQGHTEVYRYDSAENKLDCLSCTPTGAAAVSDATLQPVKEQTKAFEKARNTYIFVNNLRPDGRRAFFQSSDPLVAADTDQRQDVYEWEDDGVGTCDRPGGCIFLISSGHSRSDDSLHAVSANGNDAFFVSGDRLLGADPDETPSIYDARVEGGFPEPTEPVCEGEGCRGGLTSLPPLPTPSTAGPGKGGKTTLRHCPSGKRRVKRHGKVQCVRRHHKHHHRLNAKKGAEQ